MFWVENSPPARPNEQRDGIHHRANKEHRGSQANNKAGHGRGFVIARFFS